MRGQRRPFSALARRYVDDLAIIWIDSHPDIGIPASHYPGFHAMAVAALTGHGDPGVQQLLPATVSADRVALVGLHAWAEDDIANVARWGIGSFSPAELRATTQPLGDWLAATGCARVAIHFDSRGLTYRPQQHDNPDASPLDHYIAKRYAEGIPITVVSRTR